ncbi:hypothetical protein CEE37_01635 [candidate division LCP-89 bacterium B3_LCP]|uniref:DUF1848 domain-containing protein n=1 Tax=candidate division LCP-89 bacterium B3_LCP TaxID=2012998 RepID=A0A532V5E7_UNCL8|nr:MAG: hypothetical protein CEE37_01635 [candidate division LCP-89 bacterium B3_LCP]
MIISASRRTDIPAFYSDWFINRIREGFCLLQNPYNKKQVRKVDLSPDVIDAFIFWTKNPRPMFGKLSKIDDMNFDYIFLYTCNDYPEWLEPNIPNIDDRINDFRHLSDKLGPKKVIWRYDPIILTSSLNSDFHFETFKRLCSELSDYTKRVIISFVDLYSFVLKRLKRQIPEGESLFDPLTIKMKVKSLSRKLADIAEFYKLDIFSCAELIELSGTGILPGACIDGMYLYSVFEKEFTTKKDPGQREECKCAISVDIGGYDTCMNQCPYCYALKSQKVLEKNYKSHDPLAPSITGWIEETKKSQVELNI